MPVTTSQSPLAVIGFNSLFDGLADIDYVEAALYRGDVIAASEPLSGDYSDLCKQCANVLVEANTLSAAQIALLVVDSDSDRCIDGASAMHYSCETVGTIELALQRSEQIIEGADVAVLIITANLAANAQQSAQATISFDADFSHYTQRQGVACLLLASPSFALKHNCVQYGLLENISSGAAENIESVIQQCFASSAFSSEDINCLEVSALAQSGLKELEQRAIINTYQSARTCNTAISCHKSVLGENGLLSSLMAIIHSVISLQQRYRPAIKAWKSPTDALLSAWQDSAFYLLNAPAPSFPRGDGKAHVNAVSLLSAGRYSHLIISEVQDGLIHNNGFNRCGSNTLFIVGASCETDLLADITELKGKTSQADFKALAQSLYVRFVSQQATKNEPLFCAVLIAESADELEKEKQLALTGIKQAFLKQGDWKTPKGSYFTSCPTFDAKTAFLYPGIGATYVGLGRDLFHLFPEIYPSVVALADNIGASLKDELLNPRSVCALDFKALKQLDLALRNNLANIAECGVGYACVFTKIFEQVFNIKADFASGYSMGEISMFAALGCWQTPGLMSARLAQSDTFNHQLSGELRAIRKLWNLADIPNGDFEQIWETYSIKGTAELVNAAIEQGDRVYITIINTPDSLVIGGYPEDCLKVIKRLGVRAMPLNMANAIHSEPAYQEYQNMLALYDMPVSGRIDTKMISSSCYLPIPQLQKAIAVSIAKCLCEPVDFPRLINTLRARDCKVFIEMGAGRSLCSWTDKILTTKASEHISVPVNAKGTDDQLTYARAVAKLLSFGVEVNLTSFFSGSLIQQCD